MVIRKSDDKVDEFRNFIRETEKVWKEYGFIYSGPKDFTEDLEKHYNHILPTVWIYLVVFGIH